MVYCVVMITTLVASCKAWKRHLCAQMGAAGLSDSGQLAWRPAAARSWVVFQSFLVVCCCWLVVASHPLSTLVALSLGSCIVSPLIRDQFGNLDSKNCAKFVDIWDVVNLGNAKGQPWHWRRQGLTNGVEIGYNIHSPATNPMRISAKVL